jgi:hypothetical protein
MHNHLKQPELEPDRVECYTAVYGKEYVYGRFDPEPDPVTGQRTIIPGFCSVKGGASNRQVGAATQRGPVQTREFPGLARASIWSRGQALLAARDVGGERDRIDYLIGRCEPHDA